MLLPCYHYIYPFYSFKKLDIGWNVRFYLNYNKICVMQYIYIYIYIQYSLKKLYISFYDIYKNIIISITSIEISGFNTGNIFLPLYK